MLYLFLCIFSAWIFFSAWVCVLVRRGDVVQMCLSFHLSTHRTRTSILLIAGAHGSVSLCRKCKQTNEQSELFLSAKTGSHGAPDTGHVRVFCNNGVPKLKNRQPIRPV